MAQINIKMGSGSADWYATHGTAGYAGLVSDLSSSLNADVLANCNLSTKISAWIASFYSDCVNA
jgi:hypothetical protein